MPKFGRRTFGKIEFGLFTLPVLIGIVLAFYIPFFMSMYYSLTDWNGISKHTNYIGFDNFKQIFSGDANFASASLLTMKFSLLFILLSNVLALLIAVLLDRNLKTSALLRAAFFIPYILSLIIVGFIWKFIFSQGFQSLAEMTGWGIFDWSWLGTPKMAFISVLLVSVWQSIGFYIVIYIAGLQSVPADLLEAATVDGAGPFRRFRSVTLPLLAPSVTIAVFMSLTNSIKVFDVILSLTGGGPGGSTYSVSFDIYRETFQNNLFGYGTAKALVLFVVVLLITVLQLTYFKRKEVEH
ncbi:ABC transporter permease subunit [Cohnella sp. CFH 77786]|uniref:carbohydrate ABC transporter permease n=1 Tax=Cohnella sp. CFH 77786 TaxID=2662265 RepID=UPI001C60CAD5|nr:sugar ABC transporter permease [Cohnella sp. CFH 77786]MBW5449422.1 ABC transporter permease subunit [Cohnella sp. CFH 77786]